MLHLPRRPLRAALIVATAATALGLAPAANAQDPSLLQGKKGPKLDWQPCADAPGYECTTARVPLDYGKPKGDKIDLAVTRLPAKDPGKRIGSLFVNFGGPGGTAVDTVQAIGDSLFASLNERFDIVGFDPRGVGQSSPSIDCKANQETQGVYSQPFVTPDTVDAGALVRKDSQYIQRCLALNPDILPYVSTANVARDMDQLRAAVGDKKLTYLGFSYGTFLGATYESLFPHNYRALVLDGALDADQYINDPMDNLSEQSAGFERAIGRFFQACAAHQDACEGFGGDDPWAAFDQLAEQADVTPIPAGGDDPRPVDGDDLRAALVQTVYAKQFWPYIADALAAAANGDGTGIRFWTDVFYGWQPDGGFDPLTDRYFTISALEQRYTNDVQTYISAGRHSYNLFDHAWWNSGYVELNWGLYPVKPKGVFYGPFRAEDDATPTLVVATTYDPATPYKGSKQLVKDLGNARLLTMRGDGHTAYGGNSPCIDAAVDAYLIDLTVPDPGTTCQQDVPFAQPTPTATLQASGSGGASRRKALRRLGPGVTPAVAGAAR